MTSLASLLSRTRFLLLDFDGPVCAIFDGRPAHVIVAELIVVVRAEGVIAPEPVASSRDPFDVLRYAATVNPQLAERVELALRRAEVDSTGTARPTPHAVEVIRAYREAGRAVAIVSNNSAAAVHAYLDAKSIDVDAIVARTDADPALLKPSPHLVHTAIDALRAQPATSVLVGDSASDVAAARNAAIASIGFANKPGKREALANAGADVVIDDMRAMLVATPLARA
jgi:phosphoglycolate phosphatase